MRKASFLLLGPLVAATAAAAPAWAADPGIAPEKAPTSNETAAPEGEAFVPSKWSLSGPPAPSAGAEAGARTPAVKPAARKPRIYGGARMSSGNHRVRRGAQVGVKLPF
jgi:hypothetical protein